MRGLVRTALALGGCWWMSGGQAQEAESAPAPGPDLDFLEYLGTWAEEDDEWFVIEEWQKDNADDADDADEQRPERRRSEDDEGE
jgi:hypothetical protein